MPTTAQNDIYTRRINDVVGYIRNNLDGDLSLDALARVGCFSKFHFHRVFKSVTDETVSDLVSRTRVERAANLLRTSPAISITAAAVESGFGSAAEFSRVFKRRYGITARQWDRISPLEKNSKNCQFREAFPRYSIDDLENFAFAVELRSLPRQRLGYVRVYDSYRSFDRIKDAYRTLIDWYRKNGGDPQRMTLYGMSQDNPDVTPLRKCRFDWCVAIPDNWNGAGKVAIAEFPACRIAAIRCTGDLELENKVIQYLFRYWLPRSRFQPANLPGMEIYRHRPDAMDWKEFDIDCAVPVIPL